MIQIDVLRDNTLIAYFRRLPNSAQSSLVQSVTRMTLRLQKKVQVDKLSGQVLHVRTGTLRRSIAGRIVNSTNSIEGIVNTNVEYGALHEYGFQGEQKVRGHLRKITSAWGKRLRSPEYIQVAEYSRKVDYPVRSFLRTALREILPEVEKDITDTLMGVI